ncbi:MAG TPA: hypothetical protein VEH56_07215 [Candidatus Saccharimonadales bacterium]|nr:hypothetical protein [Candidatus Saccharimonadales bacterium]
MGTDDRFEEIRRLLDSTINEFQSLFQSAGGFEDTRVGNGWVPDQIPVEIRVLEPKPLGDLQRTAESRKRSLFSNRISLLKPKENEILLLGEPRLKLIPFWRIRGFHECFYFRGNSYAINLGDDVIAVEVEGKVRDLLGHELTESQKLKSFPRRLLGKRDAFPKSIHLNEVTELAYLYKDGSLFVNAEGKEDLEAEAFFEGSLPIKRITQDQLLQQFPNAQIISGTITKEDLVRRLHELTVKPPATFSKILTNRFQVNELTQFLIPAYTFKFEWKESAKEVCLHGFTGAVLNN